MRPLKTTNPAIEIISILAPGIERMIAQVKIKMGDDRYFLLPIYNLEGIGLSRGILGGI